MTAALEKEKYTAAEQIEAAERKMNAVNGFLTLCCFACEDEHSLVALSDFWDLFDLIQREAKEARDILTAAGEGAAV